MADIHEKYIIPHSEQLTNLNTRMETAERDIRELKLHDEETAEKMEKISESLSDIHGSLKVLLPIVYSMLGMSVLAFLSQLFNQFAR